MQTILTEKDKREAERIAKEVVRRANKTLNVLSGEQTSPKITLDDTLSELKEWVSVEKQKERAE